ncbi:hypothetical protein LOTGIDRAFT_166538 [Lottia gigantea]|uniref:Paired domain-containing protein n=1 Tax=Lottia gigantea TaxID=225164 RepID=V4A295_LOTGI|nr:hypothetical protein LOTGIDRAFT_166538 [Lottia gigantea]ESO87391.1 hypothetical protein LOTGIDRAFT_166538 [Lottia gigantea]
MASLTSQQREQAIGRLNTGPHAQVIVNAFNCSVRTIERLRIRYNTTNSTDDRPRCDRPRITTPISCSNICMTDSPQRHRQLVRPLATISNPHPLAALAVEDPRVSR